MSLADALVHGALVDILGAEAAGVLWAAGALVVAHAVHARRTVLAAVADAVVDVDLAPLPGEACEE